MLQFNASVSWTMNNNSVSDQNNTMVKLSLVSLKSVPHKCNMQSLNTYICGDHLIMVLLWFRCRADLKMIDIF